MKLVYFFDEIPIHFLNETARKTRPRARPQDLSNFKYFFRETTENEFFNVL